jgi:hypothetical protein
MGDEPAGEPVELMSVGALSTYLIRVCPLLLDVEDDLFQSSLGVTVNQRILEDFINEPKYPVLLVKKIVHETEGRLYIICI